MSYNTFANHGAKRKSKSGRLFWRGEWRRLDFSRFPHSTEILMMAAPTVLALCVLRIHGTAGRVSWMP